jgi:deoxycytidylate deaminase
MITSKDRRWMEVAKKVLIHSSHPSYMMGSILVSGGRIISSGTNSEGPPAFFVGDTGPWLGRHAEVRCLTGIEKKQTKGATLYIAGITKKHNIILTKPCINCLNIAKKMLIKRVVFHSKEGEIREERI